MIIFPAMDLMGGMVVKLESREHRGQERIYGTPAEVADRWLNAGAKWLHVVDLNAALGEGSPNHLVLLPLLPRVAKAKAHIQWGGGVRDSSTLRALLDADTGDFGSEIDRVIIGTRAIRDWEWLEAAAETYPYRIVVAIDARGMDILVAGWQEKANVNVLDFLKKAGELKLAGFLYTNVDVEGQGKGVDWDPIQQVIEATSKPVIFSGGVTTLDEVARFKELKAHGIVIGSALYSKRIDFAKAQEIAT